MSPNIIKKNEITKKKINTKEFNKIKKNLIKIRSFVEKNFKFVGDEFPSKIREIYYENKKDKNIYGTATIEERLELEEEGIELSSIPWIDNKKN